MQSNIHRLIELHKLLDKFSQVERQVERRYKDGYRHENDTEHSYNLAMTAWYLSQDYPHLDKDLIIRYALVHDLVEAHAGDTYIYGNPKELTSKEAREKEAEEKLKSDWPDFQEMNQLIINYEEKADAEARFVYALDKIMPVIAIYVNDGRSWATHHVTAKMLYENKLEKVKISPEIYPYFLELHELLLNSPETISPSQNYNSCEKNP